MKNNTYLYKLKNSNYDSSTAAQNKSLRVRYFLPFFYFFFVFYSHFFAQFVPVFRRQNVGIGTSIPSIAFTCTISSLTISLLSFLHNIYYSSIIHQLNKTIMKTTIKILAAAIICQFVICNLQLKAQNIGINSTGATPNNSAMLDIDAAPGNNKGLLIPRVALTDTADVTTITTPATSLQVYNTNVAMAGGNGVGYYSYNGTKWIYTVAPTDGPGTAGEVLTSQGTAAPPQWAPPATTSSAGGGPTGCADCITTTAVGTFGNWATCRNSCVAMGAGWRMPTWDEEVYIGSGALGTPAGGWRGVTWTSTPSDARIAGTPIINHWVAFSESDGNWSDNRNATLSAECRCVR